MSELELRSLAAEFDRLRRECDTPEKAIAQLQHEGLLDAEGQTAAMYREGGDLTAWQ